VAPHGATSSKKEGPSASKEIGLHVNFTKKSLNFTEINPQSAYFYEKGPELFTNQPAVQNFTKSLLAL